MTVTVKDKTPLVIPPSVRRQAGFKHGDTIEFKVSRKKVTIVPTAPDDDTVLTPQEAKMVRRGMKQIKEGRFKLWRDLKHELGR